MSRALKSCTLAGTSCGSCVSLLKQLLESEGVAQSKALCEHFGSRARSCSRSSAPPAIRTFSGLLGTFGSGKGCEICKPAVASILASTGYEHILEGEQASLQDSNDHFLANIQKDGSYSVVPRIPGGDIPPEKLIVIGEVARDFDLYTKITGGQRIDMFGARVDQLPEIWRRLVEGGIESGHAYGKALRTVKSCVGSDGAGTGSRTRCSWPSTWNCVTGDCAHRTRSNRRVRMRPGMRGGAQQGLRRHRHRERLEPVCRRQRRHDTPACPTARRRPRHRNLVRYIDRFLMFYIRTADRLQRTAPWVEALTAVWTTCAMWCATTPRVWPRNSRQPWRATSRAMPANGRACSTTRTRCAVRLVRQRPGSRRSHRGSR